MYDDIIGNGEYHRITDAYTTDTGGLYTEVWFNYLSMTAWGTITLGLSSGRFRVAELG